VNTLRVLEKKYFFPLLLTLTLLPFFICLNAFAEPDLDPENIKKTEATLEVPQEIADKDITNRLNKIFEVTGWYAEIKVKTVEGVVFLSGNIDSFEKKKWAMDLATKTNGVVAVVDKVDNTLKSSNFLKPAKEEAIEIYDSSAKLIPYLASAVAILIIFIFIGTFAKRIVRLLLTKRGTNKLLTKTITSLAGFAVLVIGFYFALKTSGLSTLAVTLLGGTGLIGLGLGLALKSIFENYASSIMISMKELLKMGELVNINGFEGVVQSVTTRGTTLMDYDGNNIIIPNTQVFNSTIKNYTRNPNMRLSFIVGIGYDDSIDLAKNIIMGELERLNEYILASPESIVAVDGLGASTVNLKVYFWIDAVKSSSTKVKSLVLKNVKEALVDAKVSMPDDAREVVFASPLEIVNTDRQSLATSNKTSEVKDTNQTRSLNVKEDMSNEIKDLREQAKLSPDAEKGENLI